MALTERELRDQVFSNVEGARKLVQAMAAAIHELPCSFQITNSECISDRLLLALEETRQ